MVFELMEQNLYEWIKDRKHYLPEEQVKLRIYQCLKALDHIHRHGIFHRDIKPENILLKDDQLRLADFGSCKGILSKQPYTEYISTRWYRAPECLLTDGYYDSKMDIWGLGCVFFEVLTLKPLFAGKNELDQVNKIHAVFGTPPQSLFDKFQKKNSHMDFNFPQLEGTGLAPLLPNVSSEARNLIARMLIYDATERPSAKELLRDPYFHELMEQDLLPRRRVSPTLEMIPKAPSYQPAYEHQMFPSISKSNSYLKQFRQKQKNQERARLGVKLLPENLYQTKKITLEPRKPYIPATLKLNFHKSL